MLLAADCRRPARMLATASGGSGCIATPPRLILRQAEEGLAGMALYYRWLLALAASMLAGPLLLAWAAFGALWIWPANVYEPFRRGFHVPGIALYEAVAFITLFAALGVAAALGWRALSHMRAAGTALALIRDRGDEAMGQVLAEDLAGGSWPRVYAVVRASDAFTRPHEADPRVSGDEDLVAPAPVPLGSIVWPLRVALAVAGFGVAMTLAAGLLIAVVRARSGEAVMAPLAVSALLIAAYLLTLLPVWAYARSRGERVGPAVGLVRTPVLQSIAAGLAIGLAARVLAGVWGVLLQALRIPVDTTGLDPTRLLPAGPLGVVVTVLVAVVLAPVVEEIVFRGVLLASLRQRWGDVAAIGVSSIIFALMHVHWVTMPPIMLLAWMLGRAFVERRSLWVPIAGHAAFNGVGIALIYLARSQGLL